MIADTPLFILGNPRSGTSMIRLMLTCHSGIVIPPECGFIVWLYEKFKNWEQKDNLDSTKVEVFIEALFSSKKFDTWGLEKNAFQELGDERQHRNYSELCAVAYILFALKQKKQIIFWGDKNNHYLDSLPLLTQLFPNAKYLHIVRDGRDIACSYREVMARGLSGRFTPRLPQDLVRTAEEWSGNIHKVERFFQEINKENSCVVRYEDLTAFPEKELKKICKWLDVNYEDDMLLFFIHNKVNNLEPYVS